MQELFLIQPSIKFKKSFLEALSEYHKEGQKLDVDVTMPEEDFNKFIAQQNAQAEGKFLPEGYIPQTKYWLVEGNKYIGSATIRHYLTPTLSNFGGHIGYNIRPSERKKGYGTAILKLALQKARKLGISKVLVTCNPDNIGSRRIIEKNGGVLENEVIIPNGEKRLRFWIAV